MLSMQMADDQKLEFYEVTLRQVKFRRSQRVRMLDSSPDPFPKLAGLTIGLIVRSINDYHSRWTAEMPFGETYSHLESPNSQGPTT